jgi:hypothetical protein
VPPIHRLVVGLLAFFFIAFEFFWCYLRYAVVRWIGPCPDFLILAIWLLEVVDHRGGADLIHALKSGFVIPLLVVSLGFPLLRARLDF